MGTLLRTAVFFLLFTLSSCHNLMPNCISGFYVYKKPILQQPQNRLIVENGMYLSDKFYMILYQNGTYKHSSHYKDRNKNGDMVLSFLDSKEHWGEYTIVNDTVIFQGFLEHTQELCRRWVIEYIGIINNDSTFTIIHDYDYRFKEYSCCYFGIYQYTPSKIRPDPNKAWYRKKKWYKENVHKERK